MDSPRHQAPTSYRHGAHAAVSALALSGCFRYARCQLFHRSFHGSHHVKLRISAAQPRRARPPTSGRRKAVAAVEVLTRDAIREKFRDSMSTGLQQRPRQSGANEEWSTLRDCVCEVSEQVLGERKRIQPDWFLKNIDVLQPLIDAKNQANNEMLQN
eukprot:scpid34917/ scgid17308/ 